MKKFYKWFNLILIILLIIVPLITFIPLVYLSGKSIAFANFFDNIISPFFAKLYVFNYFFGFIYTLGGIWLLITCFFNKKKHLHVALKIWITGIGMLIVPTLVFYVCIFLGMCALSLPDYSMPKIPTDPNNQFHGFPVKDLKIINIHPSQPKSSKNWACSITVHNSNSTIVAYDILFGLDYSSYSSDEDDTIQPGQTRDISIESYYTKYIKDPCATKVFVQDAGIVKK